MLRALVYALQLVFVVVTFLLYRLGNGYQGSPILLREDEGWLAKMTTGLFLVLSPLHLLFLFGIKHQDAPQVKILIQTIVGAILYTVLGSTSINSSFSDHFGEIAINPELLAAGIVALVTGLVFMMTSCSGLFYCYSTSKHFVRHAEAVLEKEYRPLHPFHHLHLQSSSPSSPF